MYNRFHTFFIINCFRGELIEASVIGNWKQGLDEISTGQMLTTTNTRQHYKLHKFLTMLLQYIVNIPPLYELK